MEVLTLLNEKGGVGRTTSAVTMAAGMAIRGGRVLLIDTDPQGHATISLGLEKRDGLLRLLAQDASWKDVTVRAEPERWAGSYQPQGALYVLPSHTNNRALPMLLDGNFIRLRERLLEVDKQVDVVIFDTPPTPTMVQGLIWLATDRILFPSMPEYLSLDGLRESWAHMKGGNEARRRYGLPTITRMGILPTLVDHTKDHEANLKLMVKFFGEQAIWRPIFRRTLWRHASKRGQSIFAFIGNAVREAAQHKAEVEAWSMVNRAIKEVEQHG